MNIVPLHSLVIIIPDKNISNILKIFPQHEILTPENISFDLVGDENRTDLANIIFVEMRRRMLLKLSLGERVIVSAAAFARREQRMPFVSLAKAQGATVIYMTIDNMKLEDEPVEVVYFNQQNKINVILPLPNNPLSILCKKFRGITVLGDIHGNAENMKNAIQWARSRNHFLWFLGDVIDYGEHSLKTLEMLYDVIMYGEGGFVLGNHERKIAKWLAQKETGDKRIMRISDGNRITIDALDSLTNENRIKWCGKFRAVLSRASLVMKMNNVTFVHAAAHPFIWLADKSDQSIEDYALYGEREYKDSQYEPNFSLVYNWINAVPSDNMVFVGHDIRSKMAPLIVKGTKGGIVIFLDTGSGKGGFLSTADLRFTQNGDLHLENFNRH